jgi:DNA-binding CsgD family transcriptional regulator
MLEIKTFEDISRRIQSLDEDDLLGWFGIITDTYLTERELIILEAQKARTLNNMKQRELSVLYCVSQPCLSVKLRKLRTKIVSVYNFLKSERLIEEYMSIKEILTPRQYRTISYVLAGYTPKRIAQITNRTHINAIIGITRVRAIVGKKQRQYPLLKSFLYKYKKNFS